MTQQQETGGNVANSGECRLRMDKAIPMPMELEYVVTVNVLGEELEACVPAKCIASNNPTVVYGWNVGTQEGNCVIVFPPTSMGTSKWRLTEKALAAIEYVD